MTPSQLRLRILPLRTAATMSIARQHAAAIRMSHTVPGNDLACSAASVNAANDMRSPWGRKTTRVTANVMIEAIARSA
jgi:hypothetical protein